MIIFLFTHIEIKGQKLRFQDGKNAKDKNQK